MVRRIRILVSARICEVPPHGPAPPILHPSKVVLSRRLVPRPACERSRTRRHRRLVARPKRRPTRPRRHCRTAPRPIDPNNRGKSNRQSRSIHLQPRADAPPTWLCPHSELRHRPHRTQTACRDQDDVDEGPHPPAGGQSQNETKLLAHWKDFVRLSLHSISRL